MIDTVCLNKNYGTMRLLINEMPVIKNRQEDNIGTILFLDTGVERKGEGGLRTKGYFKKGYENKPLLSIITIVYNGEKYLEETIQSVINQTYDNIEYIIIDGGSTDSTLDIIKRYEEKIDYWVSERDKGIANAFNKGIYLSQGEWIQCLNADDALFDYSVIEMMIANVSHKSNIDFLYGDYRILSNINNDVLIQGSVIFEAKKLIYGHLLPHPALLTCKNYFLKYGIFDESFDIAMDYEWMLRGISEEKVLHIFKNVTNIRDGGISTTNQKKTIGEILRAIDKNNLCSNSICRMKIYFYFYSRFYMKNILKYLGLYTLYKKIRDSI